MESNKYFRKKLADLTLNPDSINYIEKRNGQVFCVSDLPVEWISLDGIPLCFTHDVCRLPETNYRSLFNEYLKNQRSRYKVPKDILKRTLVIFGVSQKANEDIEFKKWHPYVEKLSEKLVFVCKHCTSIDSVKQAIEETKPELVIFDCHGGYDEKTRTSYLIINNEKLTGDQIIKNGISAPIVFLSACNTAPVYGYTGLIGEAFFQAGAFSVVSTFTPVSIGKGSLLYFRLLNNLDFASRKSIHTNWLEFTSHLLRSSFLQECFYKSPKNKKKFSREDKLTEKIGHIQSDLMDFRKRRKIFSKIKRTGRYRGGFFNFDSLSGENFLYTHLGRGDLIYFESWLEDYEKRKNT